jgi:hypothetical protein
MLYCGKHLKGFHVELKLLVSSIKKYRPRSVYNLNKTGGFLNSVLCHRRKGLEVREA